ncbi:MAG: acetylxylan esterase [Kiritimatiellae bacterium]|nr:acetylxylan esterase [Kiritimatiellia bacterium]
MKKRFFFVAMLTAVAVFARKPNYDEAKVKPYTLEDPLTFVDGRKVGTPEDWARRRLEILEIFQREMYGRMPPPPENLSLEVLEEGKTMDGFAVRKQVRMRFKADKTGPKIDWLILRPAYAKRPVPAILFLNYRGNQEFSVDPEVLVSDGWFRNNPKKFVFNHRVSEKSRGVACTNPNGPTTFPLGMILARGYAVVTACYGEISPDPQGKAQQDELAYTGVFSLWPPRNPARTDNTTSLNAWAWGLMRGLDMLEREPAIDAKRVAVTGCSRLGKAALIAGAFDERFPVVIPNQTGGGGAPLAKRDFGENVSTEMRAFTHWYCKAYGKYVDNEEAMPFDQHLLLAAVAPRRLLVEGFNSGWFDPKGEYLSCRAASCVWKMLGKSPMPDVPYPDDLSTDAIGGDLGYYHRPGNHGINDWDWLRMLDFADRSFAESIRR